MMKQNPAPLTAGSILDRVRIAHPCHQSWASMSGDDRRRFCQACRKHVYNFADMREAEILDLLRSQQGNVCAQLYRRADGTLLTADCPVGLRAAARRVRRVLAGAVALVLTATGLFLAGPRLARAGAAGNNASARAARFVGERIIALRVWIGVDEPEKIDPQRMLIGEIHIPEGCGSGSSPTSSQLPAGQ
ncbi:MAG: hypothetical protein ACKVX7_18100 [Planctomycetota bacterium]